MAETKSFDPAVLATLTTGTLLVQPFGLAHEAAEWVLGHPVWTHQWPKMSGKMRDAVLAQFPDMPVGSVGARFAQVRDEVRARYGAAVEVKRGGGETAIGPLDPAGFPEGTTADVVPVVASEA